MRPAASAAGIALGRALGMIAAFGLSVYVAYRFGGDRSTDIAFAALVIPHSMMIMVIAFFPPVFVSAFKTLEAERGEEAAWSFWRTGPMAMAVLGGAAAVVGVALSPLLARVVAGDYPAAEVAKVAGYMRWAFLVVFTGAVAAAFRGLLNAKGSFFVPSLDTLATSGTAVLVVALAAGAWGEFAVVAGVVAGAGAKVLLMLPGWLARCRRGAAPLFDPILRGQLGPIGLHCVIYAAGLAVSRALASRIEGDGAVSHLTYAERILSVPQEIFVASMGAVLLPLMAESAAAGRREEMQRRLAMGLRMAAFFGTAAAAGLIVLAEPIVKLVFERGRFDAADTRETAWCLAAYAATLPFSGLLILYQALYALRRLRPIVISGAVMLAAQAVAGVLLVGPLKQTGLALAYSISYVAAFALTLVLFGRRAGWPDLRGAASAAARAALCAAVMAAAVWALGRWTPAHVVVRVAAGAAVYAVLARFICPQEWSQASKLWKGSSP